MENTNFVHSVPFEFLFYTVFTAVIATSCIFFPLYSRASELPNSDANSELDTTYLKSYGHDFKSIVVSPADWGGDSWIKFGGVVAVTGGLFYADKGIKKFVQENKSSFTSDMTSFVRNFGELKLVIPGTLIAYLGGKLVSSEKTKRVSLLLLKTILITGVSQQALIRIGNRHRPDTASDSQKWDGPDLSIKNRSFPSGHSAISFSIATVIASEFTEKPYLKPFFFTMCGLTALSRLHDNRHWASDIFLGSAFGYYMGSVIVDKNKQNYKSNSIQKTGFKGISPIFSKGNIAGMSLAYSF